jgi:hypothetical protein
MAIKYVTLSDVLFLGAKNHGLKVHNKDGVVIEHDQDKDHVKITYKGETATIKHYASIVSGAEERPAKAAPAPTRAVRAQVSSPTDHVFAGEGRTRD